MNRALPRMPAVQAMRSLDARIAVCLNELERLVALSYDIDGHGLHLDSMTVCHGDGGTSMHWIDDPLLAVLTVQWSRKARMLDQHQQDAMRRRAAFRVVGSDK